MTRQHLHILLVEDNPGDADLIKETLADSTLFHFRFTGVARMSEALVVLTRETVDLILLDLNLPDSNGIATVREINEKALDIPIVVLTGTDDPQLGVEAIKAGAQDYLVKGKVTVGIFERVLRYALERHHTRILLRSSEQFFRATLDALSAHIAILDQDGLIIAVNRAWIDFAQQNNGNMTSAGPGANYLMVCEQGANDDQGISAAIAEGIRRVINGESKQFQVEYPCHSPEEPRWFSLRVTPFSESGKRRVVVAHENITARKLAERAQQKSEGLFEKVFETVPIGLWLFDTHGNVVRGNPEAWRIWGSDSLATQQEFNAVRVRKPELADSTLPFARMLDETLNKGMALYQERLDIEALDGKTRTVLNSSVPLKNAADEIEGAIISSLNVTKRRKAEEALISSEQRLRRVFDTSPSCLFIRDHDGRYMMVNKTTADLFAKTPEELVGKTDEELGIRGFALGNPKAKSMGEGLDPGGSGSRKRLGHEECIERDGGKKWFRVHTAPITFTGAPDCELTSAIDITAQRKAREKLRNSELMTRAILDSLSSRIHLMDRSRRIIWANKAACRYAGKERHQMEGALCFEFFGDKAAATFCKDCPTQQCLASGAVSGQIKRTQGGRTWLAYAHPIHNAQGEIVSIVEVADDITERLSLETQLRQAQKMESLGTLAGGIAHDFNNILSGIVGFSELAMLKAELPPDIHGYLKEIFYAGMRATDLVRQILTFSRKCSNERQPLQAPLVIREALKLLRSTLPTSVEMKTSIEKYLDPVLADPTQIHQIIMNLCTNASHAMEPDGGVLTVTLHQITPPPELFRLHPHLAPGSYLELKVQDTGSGIPEEHLPYIFDPYFTTKELGEGTGLGLAVVHGIVKEYGGDIFVESIPGKGTTFTILLPVTASAEHARQSIKNEQALIEGRGNILVVDDEPLVCKICQGLLEKAGYAVTTLSDPLEALELFAQNPDAFDLIISDVTMPKMKGNKLGQQMLAIRPDLPIILMTGFNQTLSPERVMAEGFRALLAKPLEKNVLLQSVKDVLLENAPDNRQP